MKTLALSVLLVATASVTSVQAKTADTTVLGFHLGEPFALPECARSTDSTPKSVVYEETDTSLCFEVNPVAFRERPVPPNTPVLNDQHVKIYFPPNNEMTVGVWTDTDVWAEVIDGKLEGILILTPGLKSQDKILESLKGKYGNPTVFAEDSVQNAMGAVFASHAARWAFDNLTVLFGATVDRIDRGVVCVETKKQSEFRQAFNDKAGNGQKL